jgi:hypothetical protein
MVKRKAGEFLRGKMVIGLRGITTVILKMGRAECLIIKTLWCFKVIGRMISLKIDDSKLIFSKSFNIFAGL